MRATQTKSIGITLVGAGVVGRGVLAILDEQKKLLQQRTGAELEIRHIVVRDGAKHHDLAERYPLTTDMQAAITDPAVQVVVELIGGTTTAGDVIRAAFAAGKHVVTANKALIAARAAELFPLAKQSGVALGFEASCGGGIPIIDALTRGLLGNRIDALVGIVNGTCNFILTQMSRHGWTYDKALAEAQREGFAEADPTLDVSGRDAAQKLAILGSLAFGAEIGEGDIAITGIENVQADDIRFAAELGYTIKLLAIAQRAGEQLALRVHPTLVHAGDLLADVGGSFNAISVFGHAIGHQFFYGRGAGARPTASAVVADILAIAGGSLPPAFRQLNIYPGSLPAARVLAFEQTWSRFYLRVTARDEPGVFANITKALGDHGISLSGVYQKEIDNTAATVPVVVTTHKAREGDMARAVTAIDALSAGMAKTVCLRIIEQPREYAEA